MSWFCTSQDYPRQQIKPATVPEPLRAGMLDLAAEVGRAFGWFDESTFAHVVSEFRPEYARTYYTLET